MEVSFVIFCKGCSLQQKLLLTASLLSFCLLSTTAHVTLELVPRQVAEGESVLFLVHDLPENLLAFAWFRGKTNMKKGIALYGLHKNLSVSGPVHSDRETIYHNGSLLIERVTQQDTGYYTLRTINRQLEITSVTSLFLYVNAFLWKCGHFETYAQPTIESLPPRIAEGGNAFLLIHNPPENVMAFLWYKGMILSENYEVGRYIIDRKLRLMGPAYSGRETLYHDGSLLLHGVSQKDPGLYTLQILRADLRREEAHAKLQVYTSISLCCNSLTSSSLMVQPVTLYAVEGEHVLLQILDLPEDLQGFSWHKAMHKAPDLKIVEYNKVRNSISWGPAHNRRERVYKNGTLLLQDVTEKDEGLYILEVLYNGFKAEKTYIGLRVKKSVTRPFVQITDITVAGQRYVTFSCISPDTDVSIHWLFNNRSLRLTERKTLSPTNCGLRIHPLTGDDVGEYQCEVSNHFSVKTSLPVAWPLKH